MLMGGYFFNEPLRVQRDNPLAGEPPQELFQREGVQDVFLLDPRTAGGGDAEMDVIELCEGVGVGVDDEGDAGFFGPARVRVVEIEAKRSGVDFQGEPIFPCGIQQPVEIEVVGLALT